MAEMTLHVALRRDRLVAGAAFLLLASLTWRYLLGLAAGVSIDDLSLSSTDIGMMLMPALRPWSNHEVVVSVAMWAVMLTGLLACTAELIPRTREHAGFVAGMIGVWVAIAFGAALTQAAIEHLLVFAPQTSQVNTPLGGVVLLCAGIYQWIAKKRPAAAPRATGFAPGVRHGFKVAASYGALIAVAYICGLMNITWLGIIAGLAVIEKVVAGGALVSRLIGVTLMIAGCGLIGLNYFL